MTNSDLPALTLDTECASLYQYTNQYTKDVLTCKRVLNGNQVVIRTENNSLQLFEINVYRRLMIYLCNIIYLKLIDTCRQCDDAYNLHLTVIKYDIMYFLFSLDFFVDNC